MGFPTRSASQDTAQGSPPPRGQLTHRDGEAEPGQQDTRGPSWLSSDPGQVACSEVAVRRADWPHWECGQARGQPQPSSAVDPSGLSGEEGGAAHTAQGHSRAGLHGAGQCACGAPRDGAAGWGAAHTSPRGGLGAVRIQSRSGSSVRPAGAAGSRMERPALGIVRFLPWRPPPSAHPAACDTGAQSDLAVPSTFLSARRCLRNGAPPSVRASALVLALLSPQSGGGLGLGSPRRPAPSHARRPRAASCPSAARLVLTPEPCAARLSWAGQRWTLCSDRLLPKVEVLSPLPLQTSHSSAADQP